MGIIYFDFIVRLSYLYKTFSFAFLLFFTWRFVSIFSIYMYLLCVYMLSLLYLDAEIVVCVEI